MTRAWFTWALAALLLPTAPATGGALPRAEEGEVTGVSVMPAPGRAELVIALRGTVEVRDFMLREPTRLVIDLIGARLGAGAVATYDGQNRGGILNVRTNQFKPEVVRVVVELDRMKNYRVERVGEAVRVSFGADQTFLAWSTGSPEELAPADEASAPKPAAVETRPRPEVDLAAAAAEPTPAWAQGQDRRLSASWDKASIADVVTGFATFSGRTIILGKNVTGEVTADIKDQPWPVAFQAILASQGLQAQELPGGIIRVDAPAVLAAIDSLEPLETKVVALNYARPVELAKSLEGVLTKGRGKVFADSATNSLIITDTRSRVQYVADFARGLDIKTPQIAIQSKIIFVDRTDLEQMGIKYDLGGRKQFFNRLIQRPNPAQPGQRFDPNLNIIDLGGGSISAIGNASQNLLGSALDLVYSTTIGRFSLTAFLQALEQVDMLDVQAEPVISTLDNRQADILVGEETPIRVVDVSATTVSGAAPRANVQFKETGIRLTVTPHVTNNGQILMNLRTERSALQTLAAADLGFNFQKQTATNQLLVDDGETAVIGGLTVTEVTRSRTGIPILSSLPFLGPLFSYSTNTERRRDLVILVTPRIIDDTPIK